LVHLKWFNDPPPDAHAGRLPALDSSQVILAKGASISAEQLTQLGWSWSPHVLWSSTRMRYQGQVLGTPPLGHQLGPDTSEPGHAGQTTVTRTLRDGTQQTFLQRLQPHTPSQCRVCNPYFIHNRMPDTTMTIRSLLRTAQNLAECHTQLSAAQDEADEAAAPSAASSRRKRSRRKKHGCPQ